MFIKNIHLVFLNAAFSFLLLAAPSPSPNDISPSGGPLSGGTLVTISGSRLSNIVSVTVFGVNCTNVNIVDSSTVTCKTGAHSAGVGSVVVKDSANRTGTLLLAYTYSNAPTILSASPSSGPASGGTLVSIAGTGFQTGASVTLAGVDCSINLPLLGTLIQCISNNSSAKIGDVVVTNPDGQSDSLSNAFTYVGPPTVSSVSPSAGALAGGTLITVTGTGFLSGASVKLGSSSCQSENVTSSTSLTCITPARSSGTVTVKVTNTDGQQGSKSSAYTYQAAPNITSISPLSGPSVGGTLLTVNGTKFLAGATVQVGSSPCTSVNFISSSKLTCTTGAFFAGGKVDVFVTNSDNQSDVLAGAFTYIKPPKPTLTGISPNSGFSSGGNSIVLNGTGFNAGAGVVLGGTTCTNIKVLTTTQISCTTPAHAPGIFDVTVTNPDLQSAVLTNGFTFYAPPTLTDIAPASGPLTGGTSLTLTGASFRPGALVKLGTSDCLNIQVVSSTQLKCTTPAHASGAVSVQVIHTDSQSASLANAFTYLAAPSLTSVTPSQGPNAGGTLVTLTGTNFVSGANVSFGGRACLQTQFISATALTCITPAVATSVVDVKVTNPDLLSSSLSNAFSFEAGWTWISGSKLAAQSGSYGTKGVASSSNIPGARDSMMNGIDSSNRLWLFGGFGLDSEGNQGSLGDLWKFENGNWTWVSGSEFADSSGVYGVLGISSSSIYPGGRTNAVTWIDSHDNFWIFGGYGVDSTGQQGLLNDLWKFDGTNWTWISGSQNIGQSGNYGTLGIGAGSNIPGARGYSVSWKDSQENFWLFGGYAVDSSGMTGDLNDLWKFDGTNWIWISGGRTVRQPGVYGTKGVSVFSNMPGARDSSHAWIDGANRLWLFGGYGVDQSGLAGDLNDLWNFDGMNWTWVSGGSARTQVGSYGTKGIISSSNTPGARDSGSTWVDSSNNLWLMGGFGLDANGNAGSLNDLWKFNGSDWVWISGSSFKNQRGVYGTQGTMELVTLPGSRGYGAHWMDSNNTLWIFGGYGIDANGVSNDLNDLWSYSR